MIRRLLIYDGQWAAYADRFAERLGGGWSVRAGADREWLNEEIAGADAIVALSLPREVLGRAKQLKVFLFPGAGVLETDPACNPAGCAVSNVYEHAAAVAEYVLAAMLIHATGILRYAGSFRSGCWAGSGRLGGATHGEISGRTVGIVGYGTIGQAIARRARPFGLRVIAVCEDPSLPLPGDAVRPEFLGAPGDLPLLLAESDFLALACPLTPQTRGLLGERELARMKPSAVLINVARAEIADERALFDALRAGRIAGAALDVWYRYPASAGERLHGSELPFHELPNVLATPHLAGWTAEMVERRIRKMAENLKRLERGEALERVVLTGAWTGSRTNGAAP